MITRIKCKRWKSMFTFIIASQARRKLFMRIDEHHAALLLHTNAKSQLINDPDRAHSLDMLTIEKSSCCLELTCFTIWCVDINSTPPLLFKLLFGFMLFYSVVLI